MDKNNNDNVSFNGFENNGFIIIPPKSYEENSEKENMLHRKYITEFNKFYVNFKECNVIEDIMSKIHQASEYNNYANLDMNKFMKDLQNISSNNNILENIFTYLYFNLTILLREKNINILEYIGELRKEDITSSDKLEDEETEDDQDKSNNEIILEKTLDDYNNYRSYKNSDKNDTDEMKQEILKATNKFINTYNENNDTPLFSESEED